MELYKSTITPESLSSKLYADYPGIIYSDDRAVYEGLFEKLENTEVSQDASRTVLEGFREAFIASSIEAVAHDVASNRRPFKALLEACSGVGEVEAEEVVEDFAELDLSKALEKRNSQGLLEWRLKYLRKALGPLRKGDFGFIFKRPEVGGTTFIISEVTNFLKQTELPILWFANEEEATGIVSRLYSSLLSIPITEIIANPTKYVEDFLKTGGSKIKLCNNANIRKGQIYQQIKEIKPALVIIDQLDKVYGFDAERYDLLMKAKYQWAREIAKEFCPVIGVCQAGGSAEGKQWLDMNDIDSSHTAKQGEADWILGIGKSANDELRDIRYLTILKNKLIGGSETDPTLKHSKTQVKINLNKFIYEDIVYK